MENQYQDIELTCLCGMPFIWTSGEQKFINDLLESGKIPSVQTPKRCLECRKKRKEELNRTRDIEQKY